MMAASFNVSRDPTFSKDWELPLPEEVGLSGLSWSIEAYVRACLAYCSELQGQELQESRLSCCVAIEPGEQPEDQEQFFFSMDLRQIGLAVYIDFAAVQEAIIAEANCGKEQHSLVVARLEALLTALRQVP